MAPSPVVALNRTVAVAEVEGADAALALIDGLESVRSRTCFMPSAPTCWGDWVSNPEAAAADDAAIARSENAAERTFLQTQTRRAHV